jgi:phospholipase C
MLQREVFRVVVQSRIKSTETEGIFVNKTDRRQFLQLMGAGAMASALNANIAKALSIPANVKTGTIKDVEHIIILMQENNSFDKYFGTLQGVRGFSDPRPALINLPNASGTGVAGQVPVFLQPAGATNVAEGFSVSAASQGGPANGAPVLPPFRLNPETTTPPTDSLGLSYVPGTDHGWETQHGGWNQGQWDGWPISKGAATMLHFERVDIPYHYALADAFTVGDAYHCSVLGPTNPNRYYLWSGCIGNVAPYTHPDCTINVGGTDAYGNAIDGVDGGGSGPRTGNGLTFGFLRWPTLPEVLTRNGVSWKIYQDLAGNTFDENGDFGGGGPTSFAGTFQDNPVLYFNQYATAPTSSPLFQNGVVGGSSNITGSNPTIPPSGSVLPPSSTFASGPDSAVSAAAFAAWGNTLTPQQWLTWAEGMFTKFKSDVQNGTLSQVSWFVAPAGFSEHPDWPSNYGAWYTSQILDILVSNPEVFSKTVFIINFDENDGGFDHVVTPTPPQTTTGADGASTVSTAFEIITAAAVAATPGGPPAGPIGLGARVPFLAVSPWSKGGFVNSQVFDHTSVIQFIEQRFGVVEPNITPWRRAVAGDLTSCFNFATPNDQLPPLPATTSYLPSGPELAGESGGLVASTNPTTVFVGVPKQETGVRRTKALPYQLEVLSTVNTAAATITLQFVNSGKAAAVFQVRSINVSDIVRNYTVEPGKSLSGTWKVPVSYGLTVFGPNGFVRYFNGSIDSAAAVLEVQPSYGLEAFGSLGLKLTNLTSGKATVTVTDAYTGQKVPALFNGRGDGFAYDWTLQEFYGWYDLIVTVEQDPTFQYRLAGHVETGSDSFSDPALGGHALTLA